MRRNRYGEWRGGPDPLAPPYDVQGAVDSVGEEVLAGEASATRCATCCAGARTVGVASTTCWRGPAGCARRRCAAGSSTAR